MDTATKTPEAPTDYATPEEAAAAARNGRGGYILTVQTPTARWRAFADTTYTTKGDAIMCARVAMARAGDASRVVLLDAGNRRVHVPAPRELRKDGAR